jgi:DNA polymerase-1
MHLIVDADPIVYRCGFASERTDYYLVVESPEGEIRELHFTPKPKAHAGRQVKEWIADHPGWIVIEKTKDVHPDSKEEALNAVDTQFQSIEKEVRDNLGIGSFEHITVVLSGPGNYREKLAIVFPYKGNRDPDHKPYWYQAIRDHLTHQWAARVVHGREADDECAILAHAQLGKSSYVIATIDKDLDQIPGRHYNYLKQVHYIQSPADARLFFWQQCLSGDSTDGIPGCWKIGEAKARAFISKHGQSSDEALWRSIVSVYAASTKVAGCSYVGCDPAAVALITARLVYLQQKEGELWNPPGTPHGLIEGYQDD